jgi:hypothetical protein
MTAHTFFGAYMAYMRCTKAESNLPDLVTPEMVADDPFVDCGVCAMAPKPLDGCPVQGAIYNPLNVLHLLICSFELTDTFYS